jgi:hypothetical protein
MINKPSITSPKFGVPFVDKSGALTNTTIQALQGWVNEIQGGVIGVPCTATGTNVITLMPAAIAPTVQQYYDFLEVAFVAAGTSTGLVTMSYATLPLVPVMKLNGASQAGAGDLTINLFYKANYVSTLNSGNGAWVLK